MHQSLITFQSIAGSRLGSNFVEIQARNIRQTNTFHLEIIKFLRKFTSLLIKVTKQHTFFTRGNKQTVALSSQRNPVFIINNQDSCKNPRREYGIDTNLKVEGSTSLLRIF